MWRRLSRGQERGVRISWWFTPQWIYAESLGIVPHWDGLIFTGYRQAKKIWVGFVDLGWDGRRMGRRLQKPCNIYY
jgi:hypothetical protein